MKQFNKFTETGKILNALKFLTVELLSGILSPNDRINGKTEYEWLKEKHPTLYQVNLNSIVDENTFELIPYNAAIFKNISASAVKKADLKKKAAMNRPV